MKLQYIVFIWCGFLLVNFLAEGYQVTCYKCDSKSNKPCPEKAPPETLPTETRERTDSHNRRSLYPGCMKEVYKNASVWPHVIWVVRRGIDIPNAEGDMCEHQEGAPGITIEQCSCSGNYCNGSPNTSSVTHTFVALCVFGSLLVGYIRK